MSFDETCKAMADPVRRRILELLREGTMTAGQIAARFSLSDATVSYHLNQLKKAGLVFETRRKNFIDYQLNTSVLEELLLWVTQLRQEDDHEKE